MSQSANALFAEMAALKRKENERTARFVASLVFCIVFPLSLLTMGYVLATLWGWFIVPLSPANIPALGFWQALGVSVTLKLFIMMNSGKVQAIYEKVESDHIKRISLEITSALIQPWVILGFAALIKYAHENGVWAPF